MQLQTHKRHERNFLHTLQAKTRRNDGCFVRMIYSSHHETCGRENEVDFLKKIKQTKQKKR